MKSLFLYPGQMAVESGEAQLSTMLGSCVGVTIWDKNRQIGGMNHYLLPEIVGGERPSPRYGSCAMPGLIDACLAAGASKRDLVARVFGGAAVLGQVSIGQRIGEKNIETALKLLAEAGIPVVEKNVGGDKGRKISLNTATGEVQHVLAGEKVDVSGFSMLAEARDVKVLIVDDSATVRNLFERIFTKAGLTVVGTAANAFEAREIIVKTKPDVITLDIEMPQMNGVRFLEKIMKHMPIPVVMVSSLGSQGEAAMESLRLGAVEFVQKPSQFDPELLRQLGAQLVTKVRAAATSKLLTARPTVAVAPPPSAARVRLGFGGQSSGQVSGIFVSGNTGAPKSVTRMLKSFSADSPPIVITVSTLCPFLDSFVKDLKKQVQVDLRIPTGPTALSRGAVYFVPEGFHGRVSGTGSMLSLDLKKSAPVTGQLPSGDVLLESAASALGAAAVGVLLSGFGSDGIQGLGKIHGKGGYTLAENPQEASFPFIPQGAIAEGVVSEIVSVESVFSTVMAYRDRRSA